ncbi:glycosyltransferase [Aequorivita echinoideorum]|nr:glycosyltransferase [Aequorivita echinoideorum]
MKVSACIITYNQENYIRQCLEGAVMQQLNCDYEIIIGEDNSTDETLKICREFEIKYPNLIKIIARDKNLGMIGNWIETLKNCTGEFIAICEGDDYWTDPYKLQKQVDYLEINSEYGMVHTQTNFVSITDGIVKKSETDRHKNTFEDIIYKNPIATLTTCFRSNLLKEYIIDVNPLSRKWVAGDLPIWLWFSLHSKIQYIDEVTSVYRVVPGSVSNTITSDKYLQFIKSRYSIKQYFLEKYSKNESLKRYIKEDFLRDAEFHAIKLKDFDVLNEICTKYKSQNKLKYYFFYILLHNKYLFDIQFDTYRVLRKIFRRNKKYSM